MKFHKTIYALSLIILCTACKQSGSENKKEMQGETTEEVVNNKTTEKPVVKKGNPTYELPFCNNIIKADILAAFPSAQEITIVDMSDNFVPRCNVRFMNNGTLMNATLSGLEKNKVSKYRKMLDFNLSKTDKWNEVAGIGDEAYVFPREMDSYIKVIKDELYYDLQLTSMNENNKADAVKLSKAIFKNI